MQETHTPGPWAWQKFGKEWCLTGQHGTRPIILSSSRIDGLTSRDSQYDRLYPLDPEHPDARLMAAGPELLDALFVALPYVEDALESPVFKKGAVKKSIAQIRAAIAKAEWSARTELNRHPSV